MGSNDIIYMAGGVAIFIAAYAGNVGGFKTWLDSISRPGQAQTPNLFKQPTATPKGGTITPQKAEADIFDILGKSKYQTPLGKIYDAVSSTGTPTKCWRNYPCGGKTSVAICKLTAQDAYDTWKRTYGCKTAKQAFAYEGFDNVTMA